MVTKVNGNSTSTFGGAINTTSSDTSTFGGNIDVPQIVTDAPAFGAWHDTAQTITTSTFTKLTFTTEEFDTNSNFALSKFTPTVKGYYLLTGAFAISQMNGTQILSIYKNGSEFKRGSLRSDNATASSRHTTISTIVYANGSTDYFELYGYQGRGSNATTRNDQRWTYFNGVLVRAV